MKRYIFLGLIVFFGISLRSYNLSFPSIGYHNAKENDYLSMAQEMERTQDYITRRIYFWNAFEDNPQMKVYPQPPLITYQVLLAWKIFGENLWGPRLINVLFGGLSILVIYFIAFVLFGNIAFSLGAAFLLAIMPLAIFFSRNLQPESQAFFFMLLGNLFYLRFISTSKKYNLILGGVSFAITWLYKFSFLIGVFPFLCCAPFKTIFREKKEFFKSALSFVLPFLLILATIFWLKRIGQWGFQDIGRVKPWEVFLPSYWEKYAGMIWWYIRGENFTIIYVCTTLLGIIIALVRRKGLLSRYLIGWTLAIIPYAMIFSDYLNQHNYYQMPFLVLVCLSTIYLFFFISEMGKKFINTDLLILIMILVIGASLPFAYQSAKRMYGAVFFGEDVAGESLKEFTQPDERIFLLTFPQGYAIARYAHRYVGWTYNLKEFQEREKKFNVNYICFYPVDYVQLVMKNNPDLFKYIQENYHFKEIGYSEGEKNIFYIILERGKGSDPNAFLKDFSGVKQLRNIYKIFGQYYFFYTLRAKPQEK
jgi:4-amino-4-deoxy-L-arabinose transferase-like glycosyltransferase